MNIGDIGQAMFGGLPQYGEILALVVNSVWAGAVLGLVGGLPEVPIALINAAEPLGVGGKERRRVHPRQGAGQGMALVEQLSGLLQGPVDRVQRRRGAAGRSGRAGVAQ